ncbi:hypothetical protein HZS_3247 [Henneguya salminicola]|nr:hypothetical protein HZS_3247 [Henneguya salminicola]
MDKKRSIVCTKINCKAHDTKLRKGICRALNGDTPEVVRQISKYPLRSTRFYNQDRILLGGQNI